MGDTPGNREGSLQAPTRHPIAWQGEQYYDEDGLFREMERVFDICHGCRRCVSLCHAFPTLFDLVDESETLEVDGVARDDYWKVVDQCYLCDLCFMTKCPYVPPHEWDVDFPHLMLRAKAVGYKKGRTNLRDKILTSTDAVGRFAGIPVVAETVNTVNSNSTFRNTLGKAAGIHPDAILPEYHSNNLRKRESKRERPGLEPSPARETNGNIALFVTCYGNRNNPDAVSDLIAVLEHNSVPVTLMEQERCCGMPKLELGDLDSVAQLKEFNIPKLYGAVQQGYDLMAPIPSCVLMFKQELPLMFPDDEQVQAVAEAFYDPFEYLSIRHKAGLLSTEFKTSLGKVAYHAPCHQRVQNMGPKTREILQLIPDTEIEMIERCSGHDGTYAVKQETHDISMKICRPVTRRVSESGAAHYASDCPMAAHQIQNGLDDRREPESPFTLLRNAYGI